MANSIMMRFSTNRKKSIIVLFYIATIINQFDMISAENQTDVAQTNNEIDNTFNLLEMGKKEIDLLEEHKSVTLVVGNTGSGKSTFIQWLAGKNQNTLKSKEVEKGTGEFIIEDGDRIGSSVMSQTLFPELVIDTKNNASIYDCPGFSDTRSSSYDIAATYFVKKLTDHIQFVKLVVAVNYPSVRQGLDRTDFPTLLKQTLDLIKNVYKFRDSIAIVVTKVDNTFLKGGNTLVPDESVISSIANYFRSLQKTYTEKLKLAGISDEEKIFCSKAIILLDIFLTQRKGTNYPRIQIFRRPNAAGLLKNIPLLETRKKNVEKMIHEELIFTERGPDDFGYAISDRSKNDVHNLVASINDKVAFLASALVGKVGNYYKKIINDNDAALVSSANSLNITNAYEIERVFSTKLAKDYHIINEFYNESKSITALKDLANKVKTSIITQLGIASCQREVENVALQAEYLNFLELVSSRTFTTRPRDWWNEFEKMGAYLRTHLAAMDTFDQFLNQLLEKLSEYNIQKGKNMYNVANLDDWGRENKTAGIKINQSNYMQFLKTLEEMNLVGFDAQIKKVAATDFQLQKLNHVLFLALKKPWNHQCPISGKLIIQGDSLIFSNFLDTKGKLINFCGSGKILSLNIFALNAVFIDRDLNENGIEVSIVAPKLHIIGNRSINIDGISSPSHSQSKGEPGGNFLAISQTIIVGENLTITAKGGRKWSEELRRVFLKNDKIKINWFHTIVQEWQLNKEKRGMCGIRGCSGIKDFRGKGGEIKVIQLDENSDSQEGLHAVNGNNHLVKSCSIYVLPQWCEDEVEMPTGVGKAGPPGSVGSTEGQNPRRGRTMQIISDTVRSYKIYIRENFRDYFNKTNFIEFVHKIDTNSNIQSSYDTLALVNELQDLEKQYHNEPPEVFLPFYESLLKRTIEYASNPGKFETSNSHKMVLSHLFTATLGKIHMIKKKNSELNLIIDLLTYLDSIQQFITDLKNFKDKNAKLKLIKEYQENYEQNIDEKIKEADYLIQTQVGPAIDAINYQIEQEMEKLLYDTITLGEAAKLNKYYLQEQKKMIKHCLALGWALYGVKMIGQVVDFTAPIAAIANTVLTRATTVAEPFISPTSATFKLPDHLLSRMESVGNKVTTLIEEPFSDFQSQLYTLYADTAKYPQELNDSCKMIKSLISRCEKAQATLDHSKLKELKNEFQKHLAKKVAYLDTMPSDSLNTIINSAALVLKTFKNLIPFGKFGLEIYTKIKDNNNQLRAYDIAIEEAEKEIQGIQKYQTKIYETMIPVFQSIGNDLFFNSMAGQLNNKSQVVLDVSKWDVQSFLKNVKLNMKQFTKAFPDFSVEHELQRCIETMHETITAIMNIFDRIQGYQDQQQLAVYIADISSPTASDIDIANPGLTTGMIELEKIINSNLVFEQRKVAVNAFKQHVFPFASHYLNTFRPEKTNASQDLQKSYLENLVSQAVEETIGLQLKMTEYKTSIAKSDSFMRTSWFSTDYKTSKPFFVWENEEYYDEISKLLSGEKVIFKANVLESDPDKDAIKFNKINIKFNSENSTLTQEIRQQLQGFSVHATHMGNSNYRFKSNVYIISSAHQNFDFYFERDDHEQQAGSNSTYDKIESGDAILSPYALWEFQLVQIDNDTYFEIFEGYKDLVNLELEGYGSYVIKEANISNVEYYYTVAETISDDLGPRKRELRMPVMYVPKKLYTENPSVSASSRLVPWFTILWKAFNQILVCTF